MKEKYKLIRTGIRFIKLTKGWEHTEKVLWLDSVELA